MLMDRYQDAIYGILEKVKATQREAMEAAGALVAETLIGGGKVYLDEVVHSIQKDLYYRGGGPIFYRLYDKEKTELQAGDLIFVSSVSGRTKRVVDLAYECMEKGVTVIALTSMSYATTVEPVHASGKRLHEFVTLALDNCAPPAEAMLQVDGIEAPFAACSGISSAFILWSLTSACVEELLKKGYTPGILKSANFPGGNDYNKTVIEPGFEKNGM